MAAYDLEEQEQLAEVKAWWKQHGNLVINLVTAALLAVAAWQGWNWYQRSQSAQASMISAVLMDAVQAKDTQRIKAASGELLEKFGRTRYAQLGALAAANALLVAGDTKSAKAQLEWAVENAKDELRDLARLRLAAVLLDEKAYEPALNVLGGEADHGFGARFAESRGDVFSAQGKKAEALAAYRSALAKLDENANKEKASGLERDWQVQSDTVYREILQQKIDSLSGGRP